MFFAAQHFKISHAGGAAGDTFLVVHSDGTDAYVALVRDNTATSAIDHTVGELSVTNLAKLVCKTPNVSLKQSNKRDAEYT